MCGRFTLRDPEKIRFNRMARYARVPLNPTLWTPRYNIAPSQELMVVVDHQFPTLRTMTWGLVPSWSNEPKGFINARSETLEEKPSFNESFRQRRCLIPADGFYEWQKNGKSRQPFYFQLNDESAFMFAGIWDEWHSRSGAARDPITSCAIITTTANRIPFSIAMCW